MTLSKTVMKVEQQNTLDTFITSKISIIFLVFHLLQIFFDVFLNKKDYKHVY